MNLREGLQILTNDPLGETTGILVAEKHMNARVADSSGVLRGCVGGHGGDVWWVEHPNGDVAVYSYTEFVIDELDAVDN